MELDKFKELMTRQLEDEKEKRRFLESENSKLKIMAKDTDKEDSTKNKAL